MMENHIKSTVFRILESDDNIGPLGRIASSLIVTIIIVNVLAVIFETVDTVNSKFSAVFTWIETVSVIIFTAEYIVRLWACTSKAKYSAPFLGRMRYSVTFLALIDLLAILPFYLPYLIGFDLRFIRVLRLFRFFRVLKLGRYSESLRILGAVARNKRADLSIVVFIVLILLTFSSSLMYFVENEAQPEVFSSIPATMWWGVATLTTVGYGDVCPITPLGKFLGAIISLLGIGMVALPAGIIASGFAEQLRSNKVGRCPLCGSQTERQIS